MARSSGVDRLKPSSGNATFGFGEAVIAERGPVLLRRASLLLVQRPSLTERGCTIARHCVRTSGHKGLINC